MKRWNVYGVVTAGKLIGTFEAKTAEDAERQAWESDACHVSVCHQCASDVEDPQINELIVEADG